jgi:glucose dehydrogenase
MMTLPILQSVRRPQVEVATGAVWSCMWLRLLLTGASFCLYPALAAAQTPTVSTSAAPPDDGQWTMPTKNYAATRDSALDEIHGANVGNLQVAFAISTGVDRGQEAAPIVANNTMFIDRDRGASHDATPPTPPGIRVRTTAVRPSYA